MHPVGSPNSLLSNAPRLSGAKPVSLFTFRKGGGHGWLILVFSQVLCSHRGGGGSKFCRSHGPGSKESASHAGDPGLIPGLGRSPGEGNGNPLQYSWASMVAQSVKNPPAMRETWVQSLGREDPLLFNSLSLTFLQPLGL